MIRNDIVIFNTRFLTTTPTTKKKKKLHDIKIKSMYQMLKNAFTYSLIQYSNREHAIYLSFQGPYAVCRTHSLQ